MRGTGACRYDAPGGACAARRRRRPHLRLLKALVGQRSLQLRVQLQLEQAQHHLFVDQPTALRGQRGRRVRLALLPPRQAGPGAAGGRARGAATGVHACGRQVSSHGECRKIALCSRWHDARIDGMTRGCNKVRQAEKCINPAQLAWSAFVSCISAQSRMKGVRRGEDAVACQTGSERRRAAARNGCHRAISPLCVLQWRNSQQMLEGPASWRGVSLQIRDSRRATAVLIDDDKVAKVTQNTPKWTP